MRKQKSPVELPDGDDETREQWKARMQAVYSGYKFPALRALVSYYYENQERRLAQESRTRTIFEFAKLTDEQKVVYEKANKLLEQAENEVGKELAKVVEEIPIYKDYLSEIVGVGPITSACLIAYIQDIGKFDTISKLHRYAGLSAIGGEAQRRHAGVNIDFNPKMKTLMFKIGKSFLTSHNEKYRAIYDEAHRMYEARGKYDKDKNPGGNKNKMHLMYRSLKKPERIFLANLWVEWRKMEGLPISDPWIFAIGGHDKRHMIAA